MGFFAFLPWATWFLQTEMQNGGPCVPLCALFPVRMNPEISVLSQMELGLSYPWLESNGGPPAWH